MVIVCALVALIAFIGWIAWELVHAPIFKDENILDGLFSKDDIDKL